MTTISRQIYIYIYITYQWYIAEYRTKTKSYNWDVSGRNTLYAPVDNNRNNNNICRSVGPDKRARLDRSAEIESYSRESLLIENPVNRRAVCGSEQPVRKIGTLSSVAIVRSAHCVPICVCRTDRTGLAAAGDGAQGHHRRCRKCLGPAPVEPTNNNGQKRAPTSFVSLKITIIIVIINVNNNNMILMLSVQLRGPRLGRPSKRTRGCRFGRGRQRRRRRGGGAGDQMVPENE